jgi:hypothetical protein
MAEIFGLSTPPEQNNLVLTAENESKRSSSVRESLLESGIFPLTRMAEFA